MTCTRCQGCMAKDYFLDLMESSESMWMAGWRCLNCGNVFDPVVEKNHCGQGMAAAVSIASSMRWRVTASSNVGQRCDPSR